MFPRVAIIPTLFSILHVAAQQDDTVSSIPPFTFFYGFNALSGNLLTQCDTLSLFVTSLTGGSPVGVATPPYTLFSYTPGGVGVETVVGSNTSDLSWQVLHPAGSPVFLSMVDSVGNQGGVPPLFTVQAGSASCLPKPPKPSVTVAANSTSLQTCDPLRITVDGGKKPYQLELFITGSNVTNVMLGPNDNEYTWINRAPPNVNMIVTAIDANMQRSAASDFISTTGSEDATCPGLHSSSGSVSITTPSPKPSGHASGTTSSTSSSSTQSAPADQPKSQNSGAIAGGMIAGISVLIVLLLGLLYLFRRRRNASRRKKVDIDGPAAAGRKSSVRLPYGRMQEPSEQMLHSSPYPSSPHQPSPRPRCQYPPSQYMESQHRESQYRLSQYRQSQYSGPEGAISPYGYSPSHSPGYTPNVESKNRFSTQPSLQQQQQQPQVNSPFDPTQALDPFGTPTPSINGMPLEEPLRAENAQRHAQLGLANPGDANDNVPRVAPAHAPAWSEKQQRLRERMERDLDAQPVIVRHRDAGAIVDLPPAYGEQESTLRPPRHHGLPS